MVSNFGMGYWLLGPIHLPLSAKRRIEAHLKKLKPID